MPNTHDTYVVFIRLKYTYIIIDTLILFSSFKWKSVLQLYKSKEKKPHVHKNGYKDETFVSVMVLQCSSDYQN